jgi:hypothetical protein
MASVAEKKRARKSRTVSLARTGPANDSGPAPTRNAAPFHHKSGLEWLRDKRKISPAEYQAGMRYGNLMRIAALEGAALMKSCLDTDGVRGTGTPTFPGKIDTQAAAWKQQAVEELTRARAAMSFHVGLVASLDVICGAGTLVREVTKVQREAEEIENGLRIALQILVEHWSAKPR